MSGSPRVLVVGTTSDYIDWIRSAAPGRALFLTDPGIRRRAQEAPPDPSEEVLCDLTATTRVHEALEAHLRDRRMHLSGVACFDCESMALAAGIAAARGLPYPSVEAVGRCRDKYLSKKIWRQEGVRCPRAARVSSPDEAEAFSREAKGPIVLKPATGSGSELVFVCAGPDESRAAFTGIETGLVSRRGNRLYPAGASDAPGIIAEEYVEGEEYSCDVIIEKSGIGIIRLTRKIRSPRDPFGTTRGYVLIDALPPAVRMADLGRQLRDAAWALGVTSGICMADLILRGGDLFFLEMTPRPGGDCLPSLLREAAGIDILMMTLDVAEGRPVGIMQGRPVKPRVGLRLLAGRGGVVREIDWARLAQDPRVRQVNIIRKPADTIRMPPEDYDSWLLGHVIFAPSEDGPELPAQCDDMAGRLTVRMAS
ncbi:ATP-grasp domain-containing protein [Desulfococcus sp.]|uniref:ATP-grasp domain-containing protein n=1 Tax=Desulfococcus sp. TaxID=2025834 RepID=UPI0035932DD0